jgi:hypothetical protein
MKHEVFILDDSELDIPVFSSICCWCVHYLPEIRDRICKAFPDGIPMEIWMGENDHKQPYKGDHGIMFELRMINPPTPST